jgi:hypothetical protein
MQNVGKFTSAADLRNSNFRNLGNIRSSGRQRTTGAAGQYEAAKISNDVVNGAEALQITSTSQDTLKYNAPAERASSETYFVSVSVSKAFIVSSGQFVMSNVASFHCTKAAITSSFNNLQPNTSR